MLRGVLLTCLVPDHPTLCRQLLNHVDDERLVVEVSRKLGDVIKDDSAAKAVSQRQATP
jgi:hypothetical protein